MYHMLNNRKYLFRPYGNKVETLVFELYQVTTYHLTNGLQREVSGSVKKVLHV